MPAPAQLTERQQKWFAALRSSLERETGKTVEQWAEIALACPPGGHRARLAWMKATHGLGQNHASLVLNAAFPPEASWCRPDALADALWSDPTARAIFHRLRDAAAELPETIVGQRKSFTAFSRKVQFAASRPTKAGVRLGLALAADHDAALREAGRECWSERLKSAMLIAAPAEVNAHVSKLLRDAWERSGAVPPAAPHPIRRTTQRSSD